MMQFRDMVGQYFLDTACTVIRICHQWVCGCIHLLHILPVDVPHCFLRSYLSWVDVFVAVSLVQWMQKGGGLL